MTPDGFHNWNDRSIDNEIDCGVVATELIPKGTITWVRDKLDHEFSGMDLIE